MGGHSYVLEFESEKHKLPWVRLIRDIHGNNKNSVTDSDTDKDLIVEWDDEGGYDLNANAKWMKRILRDYPNLEPSWSEPGVWKHPVSGTVIVSDEGSGVDWKELHNDLKAVNNFIKSVTK